MKNENREMESEGREGAFAFMPRCLVAFMPASQQHDIYQSLN